MSNYKGDILEDASLTFRWNTSDGSGGSITRATDGTVKVIRGDGTDCTGTSVTDSEDTPDTGIHTCTVDTSDNANYTTGNDYSVWLDGAVIDGETVNAVIAEFSIENRSASLNATATANLELQYDGTGYVHDTAPATQLQLAGISGGLAMAQSAEAPTVAQPPANGGTVTSGTYESTQTHDGVEWVVTDSEAGEGINFYLQFDIGEDSAMPVACHLHAWFEDPGGPSGEVMYVQAYNFNSSEFQTVEVLQTASAEEDHIFPLTINHVGHEGADPGIVRIRFRASASAAANVMRINHCTVDYVNSLRTDSDGYILVSSGVGVGQISMAAGVVDGNVASMDAGVVTATAIGADAITEAKIADDAIAAEHFADNAITAASINTGAFTADAFAADALIAATFATGAFTADAFAADALIAATFATGALTADAFAADALVAGTFATGAFTADAFAADAIVAATFATGAISADAVAATALNNITITDPEGTFDTWPKMMVGVWRHVYEGSKLTGPGSGQLLHYKDDGTTVATTQTVVDAGGVQTLSAIL